MSREHETKGNACKGESGMALVLALLALMLLTFLGLTLAATTSTELQIASNFRWNQQALYNAEAGIELGKRFLRDKDWATILPLARVGSCPGATCVDFGSTPPALPAPLWARNDYAGQPHRNFENSACDTYWWQGMGAVLDQGNYPYPFQNIYWGYLGTTGASTTWTLEGTFTLWVRRPLLINPNGIVWDETSNDVLVLTAEGTAPGTVATAANVSKRAVRYLEVRLQKPPECPEDRLTGSGYSGCPPADKPPCPAGTPAGATWCCPPGVPCLSVTSG